MATSTIIYGNLSIADYDGGLQCIAVYGSTRFTPVLMSAVSLQRALKMEPKLMVVNPRLNLLGELARLYASTKLAYSSSLATLGSS